MSQPITIEASSLQEALQEAATQLGAASVEDLEYRFDREHFRTGARTVKVHVLVKASAAPVAPELVGAADRARGWVEELMRQMGIEASVTTRPREGGVVVTVRTPDDNGLLIGKDGRNIEALQVLVDRAAERMGLEPRIVFDVGDYRSRRDDQVKAEAKAVAQRVARSGEAERMRPMNAYERHLVHAAVQEVGGVGTRSIGDGGLKEVEIRPAD